MGVKKPAEEERRFDVTQLIGDRMEDKDEGSGQSIKVLFQEWVLTRAAHVWPVDDLMEEK